MPTRRSIRYASFAAMQQDIRALQASGYSRCGQWGLKQICEHLDLAIRGSMTHLDDVPMGWLMRNTVGPLALNYILRTGRLRAGFEAPGQMQPQPDDAGEAAMVERFLATVQETERATDFVPSPFFGRISPEQWRAFHLVHCGHHLSHLVPTSA